MRLSGIHGFVSALLVMAAAQICSAQLFPTSSDAAAKVLSMTGQVSVLRDSEQWALNVGDLVQTQQVILTGPDGYAKFETSDGSTFEVYPSSNVIFRKNPGSLHDLLDLFVGRVKIHIQRWGGQPNPNRIMTPTAVISVRRSQNRECRRITVRVQGRAAGEKPDRQERSVPSHRARPGRRCVSGCHQPSRSRRPHHSGRADRSRPRQAPGATYPSASPVTRPYPPAIHASRTVPH
jgi:hypothetical protein